jgi:hypothetical protein
MEAGPKMTSSGLYFPETTTRSAYLSLNKHRLAGGPGNKWDGSRCPVACEYEIFCQSEDNSWRDSRPPLWGLRKGLPQIGTNRERLAKFPARQNQTDPWHGYPVSALDHRREIEHRPEPALVRRWREAGLIDDVGEARINRGKV